MSKEVKISVIKFEMVNGKKTYKSFTFKLNPKEMAKFKTEATVKKKVAEYVAKSGVYKPSELKIRHERVPGGMEEDGSCGGS